MAGAPKRADASSREPAERHVATSRALAPPPSRPRASERIGAVASRGHFRALHASSPARGRQKPPAIAQPPPLAEAATAPMSASMLAPVSVRLCLCLCLGLR